MFLVPINRETRQLSRYLDDTLDRFFSPLQGAETVAARSPALDVAETDHAYTVRLEVPGVAKEDVKVSIEGRQVTVQAQSLNSSEKSDGERIVYRERSAARYARTFTLPAELDAAESAARLDQGVLTLTLPKRGLRSAAQVTVN